ncbi:hypothetical protein TNCV_394131 [Trichonephila clavipes]|nr:hypothetical protein TNCV_394131 [Trichonephila clavipes]
MCYHQTDANELIDEDEGDENEVNTGEIIIKNKSPHYTKSKTQDESIASDLLKQMETTLKDETPTEILGQFYFDEV